MPSSDVLRFSCSPHAALPPLPKAQAPALRSSPLFYPEDRQDASPTAEWFIRFTERFWGRCWLIGYRVGDDRFDRRVSIEGILIAREDLTPKADSLLGSKEPDERQVYAPGDQNTLDVTVVRFWWD